MRHDNDFFSRERFVAYFRKLWVEQWRTNMVRTGMLFGTCLLFELWVAFMAYANACSPSGYDYAHNYLEVMFSLMIFGLGCLMSARILHGGKRKGQRITMLTLPVTAFETWLARWVMTVPLFLLTFLACFYLADLIRVAVCAPLFPDQPISLMPLWSGDDGSFYTFLLLLRSLLLCSAVYTAGGVFFPRRPVLKTSVLMFFIVWFFFILGIAGSNFLFADSNAMVVVVSNIFWWCAIPFLWWLSYARFKELDVAD